MAATHEYEESEDRVGQFLADCTSKGSDQDRVLFTDVYQRYDVWCYVNRVKPEANSVFGRELTSRGFRHEQSHGKRWRYGLKLNPTASNSRG